MSSASTMLSEDTRKAIYIEVSGDAELVYVFMSVVMKGSNKEWGKVVRELNDMGPDEKGSRVENSRERT